MKKLFILYIICVLFAVSAYANFNIQNIKGYVNDELVSGVDINGGSFSVKPGDTLEFKVEILNSLTDNAGRNTTAVRLKGVLEEIDDDSDITKTQSQYNALIDDQISKWLTFLIPDDARKDTYSLKLTVYWRYGNDSESYDISTFSSWTKTYDVTVKTTTSTSSDIDLQNSFNNLTFVCKDMVASVNGYLGYLNTSASYFDQLTTCKEEKGTLDLQQRDCSSTLSACQTDKTTCLSTTVPDLNSQISTCTSEKASMIQMYQCNNITQTKVNEEVTAANQKNTNVLLWIGGIGVAVYLYNQRKNKKPTVEEETYYMKK